MASLQFSEGQMQLIKQEIAVYQAAKMAYVQALKTEISRAGLEPVLLKTASEQGATKIGAPKPASPRPLAQRAALL